MLLTRSAVRGWQTIVTMDTRSVETFLAGTMMAWGTVALLPGWSGKMNPVYGAMTALMPSLLWSILLLTLSITQFVAVTQGVYRLRRVAALCGMWFWLFHSFTFLLSFQQTRIVFPGMFISPLSATFCYLAFWRVGLEMRIRARSQKGGAHDGPLESHD